MTATIQSTHNPRLKALRRLHTKRERAASGRFMAEGEDLVAAAARENGMSYSQLMHGLTLAGVALDRKVLADIAVRDPETFRRFADAAREASAA